MKALLIRVGIDSGAGGGLAPIFPDGSFDYIPIPEDAHSVESRRYCTEKGRSGICFSEFVPKKNKRRKLHYDPEFQTNKCRIYYMPLTLLLTRMRYLAVN